MKTKYFGSIWVVLNGRRPWAWSEGTDGGYIRRITESAVYLDTGKAFQHDSLEMYQEWLAWKTGAAYG